MRFGRWIRHCPETNRLDFGTNLDLDPRSFFPVFIAFHLWNQLPASFRQPRPNHSPSHSSHPTHVAVHYSHCFPLQTQSPPFPKILPTIESTPPIGLPSRTAQQFSFDFFRYPVSCYVR